MHSLLMVYFINSRECLMSQCPHLQLCSKDGSIVPSWDAHSLSADLPWLCVVCHSVFPCSDTLRTLYSQPPPSLSAGLLVCWWLLIVYGSSCSCVSDSQWTYCIDKWTVSVEQCSGFFRNQQEWLAASWCSASLGWVSFSSYLKIHTLPSLYVAM